MIELGSGVGAAALAAALSLGSGGRSDVRVMATNANPNPNPNLNSGRSGVSVMATDAAAPSLALIAANAALNGLSTAVTVRRTHDPVNPRPDTTNTTTLRPIPHACLS